MRLFGGVALALIVVALVVWIAGIRIVVIQPIGAIPDGITVIVADLPKLRLIDSPDAMCQRGMGGVSLMCRGSMAAGIAERGTILVRLPYSQTLFRMSGAPELNR